MDGQLLCWRNKCDLTQKENFSMLVSEGWIECCEFFLRNFEITEKTITEEREKDA